MSERVQFYSGVRFDQSFILVKPDKPGGLLR